MTQDLRHFLRLVEERAPRLLRTVKKEVSPRWEISALQKRLEADRELPILGFEKVAGHVLPVVVNLFASKEHLALALDTSPEEVVSRFASAQERPISPREVASGPVKDVVLWGASADLGILPILTHCEKDAGPCLRRIRLLPRRARDPRVSDRQRDPARRRLRPDSPSPDPRRAWVFSPQ